MLRAGETSPNFLLHKSQEFFESVKILCLFHVTRQVWLQDKWSDEPKATQQNHDIHKQKTFAEF